MTLGLINAIRSLGRVHSLRHGIRRCSCASHTRTVWGRIVWFRTAWGRADLSSPPPFQPDKIILSAGLTSSTTLHSLLGHTSMGGSPTNTRLLPRSRPRLIAAAQQARAGNHAEFGAAVRNTQEQSAAETNAVYCSANAWAQSMVGCRRYL